MKKIITLLSALLMVLAVCGCSSKKEEKYDEFKYENMVIHTPASYKFKESETEGFSYALESDKLMIFVNQIPKSAFENAGYTEEQLAELAYDGMEIKEYNGLTYGDYEYQNGEYEFYYNYVLYADDANYWDVHIACQKADKAEVQDTMLDILSRIELK